MINIPINNTNQTIPACPVYGWFFRNFRWFFPLSVIALMMLAFARWYPNDDAFISFRYAKNFIEGHGLVWNVGERVEGYSNFLWVMIIAYGMKMGLEPLAMAVYSAIPLHLITLLITYLLAKRALGDKLLGWAVMMWMGTNPAVFTFATSGLETPLQIVLFTVIAYLTVISIPNNWILSRSLAIAGLLGAAVLTRMDSILLVLGVWVVYWFDNRGKIKIDLLFALVIPTLLIMSSFFLWKMSYYGSIMPNAWNAKVRGIHWEYGLFYVYLFTLAHLILPLMLISLRQYKKVWQNRSVGYISVFTMVWLGYVVMVGGDFMNFRFVAAVSGMLIIGIVYAFQTAFAGIRLTAAVMAVLLLGNVNAWYFLDKAAKGWGIESIKGLSGHLLNPYEDWIGIGKRLGEIFEGTDITIAVGAAGAIPYYSDLKAIDFIGICDAEIPHIAERFTIVPGHRIIAPFEHLVQRRANLVVVPNNFMMTETAYYNWLRAASWFDMYRFYLDITKPVRGRILDEATLLGIPIRRGYVLVVWYLTPHPAIDRAIEEHQFKRIRLRK